MFHRDDESDSKANKAGLPSRWKKGFLPRKWVTVKDKDKEQKKDGQK